MDEYIDPGRIRPPFGGRVSSRRSTDAIVGPRAKEEAVAMKAQARDSLRHAGLTAVWRSERTRLLPELALPGLPAPGAGSDNRE